MIFRSSFCEFFILTLMVVSLAVPGREAGAVETIAHQAMVKELETGTVLFEKNARTPMKPASMAKMMTIYLVFERLRDNRL
ncbi:MAG: D-alanyl-D-alanine carboxypeptidase, partial [Rhodospirillales bacterium]